MVREKRFLEKGDCSRKTVKKKENQLRDTGAGAIGSMNDKAELVKTQRFLGKNFISYYYYIITTVLAGEEELDQSVIIVRGRLARRVREEAEKLGVSVEEYLVELLSQGLDPKDKAVEYIEAAEELLREARDELSKGNIRQAAEKLWGATALAVKAYAYWREGKRLTSHKELWDYMRLMTREMGSWVREAWMYANGMHTCFYEGWCAQEDVEDSIKRVEKLVREVANRIKK